MQLREWQYINKQAGNTTASSGYKKKFEKLIKYHIDHASSELESITRKDISNWHFRLGEHYNNGHHEFDREIVVSYDKDSNTFYLSIIIDNKQVYHNNYKSYEEVLETLTGSYMYLPDEGTPEYDDLLVEWVSMKNNSSSSASSAKTNKEKFKKILDYHIANVEPTVTKVFIKELTDDGFYYIEHRQTAISEYDFGIEVKVDKNTDSWSLRLYRNGNFIVQRQGDGWENLLKEFRGRLKLPLKGTPEYDDLLTESAASFAEDFKLYENLWEDVSTEETYYVVLGKTKYNLLDDQEFDAYLTQSAKLMRKPAGNTKPLEFFKVQKINMMLSAPRYRNETKLAQKLQNTKTELEQKLN